MLRCFYAAKNTIEIHIQIKCEYVQSQINPSLVWNECDLRKDNFRCGYCLHPFPAAFTRVAMETKKRKSLDDLRLQWAGGRDAWLRVPLTSTPLKHNEPNFIPFLLTKVKNGGGDHSCSKRFENSNVAAATAEYESAWPPIVRESILFGISAYNPRGQEAPLETNQKQHLSLYNDIQRIVAKQHPCPTTAGPAITFWDAVGIWEDGSYEPGFILAVPRKMENQGLAWSMTLARNSTDFSWTKGCG